MKHNDYLIGIVGYGVVGIGIHKLFKDDVVSVYDPQASDRGILSFGRHIHRTKKSFTNLDLIVICVPTPSKPDGSCDASIVEEAILWVSGINTNAVILVKSTIVPSELVRITNLVRSKGRNVKIVFSPEYLGESSYYTPFWRYPDPSNMESHTWQIFGGEKKNTSYCVDVFKRRMSVDTRFFQTDLLTASLCKYMENSFFATKILFCNEWYEIASAFGVDFNELRECWLADPRVNRNHTMVFPKNRGFGGKCLPKDVKAIIKEAESKGLPVDILKTVDKLNSKLKGKTES